MGLSLALQVSINNHQKHVTEKRTCSRYAIRSKGTDAIPKVEEDFQQASVKNSDMGDNV